MAVDFHRLFLPHVIAILLFAGASAADESATDDYQFEDEIPLTEDDLKQIRALVLARYPMLASSPGIRWSMAWRNVRSIDSASVIYEPHTENAGLRLSYEAHCDRQPPARSWKCDHVKIRRYLQLENQDYEVRVLHEMEIDVALALIDATRPSEHPETAGHSVIPGTVILISHYGDGYRVVWGNPEGRGELGMHATLVSGGDPANPRDWQIGLFPTD